MRSPLAWGILCLLALVWGSSFILMKRGLDSFSPEIVAAIRLISAASVLLPLIVVHPYRPKRKELLSILLIGVIGNAIPAFLFPFAESHINSATAGALNALSPVFALIFGILLFGASSSVRQWLGILIGFGGAIWLTLSGDVGLDLSTNLLYVGAVVLATVFYGISVNIMKRYLDKTPSVIATGYGISLASIPYVGYLAFQPDFWRMFTLESFGAPHPNAWTSLGYIVILGVIGTAASLVLFYRVIQMTDALFGASVTYLIPLVAIGWGVLDGERFTFAQFLAMGVILGGVYLANSKPKAAKQAVGDIPDTSEVKEPVSPSLQVPES